MQQTNLTQLPVFEKPEDILKHEIQATMPILEKAMFTDNRVRYPESRFRHYFAPFFLGIFEVPPQYNLLMLWVSEIGSYHVEVDVVDGQGNVLFVVPAILNTDGLNLSHNAQSRIRFNGLESVYKADQMNNPQGAILNYYNGIAKKLGSMFNGYSPDPNHIHKWLKIFEYYNVTPPSDGNVRIVEKKPEELAIENQQQKWGNTGTLNFEPTFD